MVAREFHKRGYKVCNILSDGNFESQEQIEKRLLDKYFPNRKQLSLIDKDLSLDEMINESYKKRNKDIGYKIDSNEDDDDE